MHDTRGRRAAGRRRRAKPSTGRRRRGAPQAEAGRAGAAAILGGLAFGLENQRILEDRAWEPPAKGGGAWWAYGRVY